jgi:hypothetical protein
MPSPGHVHLAVLEPQQRHDRLLPDLENDAVKERHTRRQ